MTREEAKVFMLQFNTDKRLNPSEHEAVRVAIKALEQEPKETWSIKDVATTFERHGLMTEQEPCEEHQREFIELVVEYPNADLCTYPEYRGKPYFSIKYRENGKYIVGFGSYKIEMISQWIKEYFIPSIQPKTDVFDKIRTEIEQMNNIDYVEPVTVDEVLKIIDKYKAESEDKE